MEKLEEDSAVLRPVESSAKRRRSLWSASSMLVGVLAAGLLYGSWLVTNAWVDQSKAAAAAGENALSVLGSALHLMGIKQACEVEDVATYESTVKNLASFLEFDSRFDWHSPYSVKITLTRELSDSSLSSTSLVIDANKIKTTPPPDPAVKQAICGRLQ